MATRCTIAIHINADDMGKTMKFDPIKLPTADWREEERAMPHNEEVTLTQPFLSVYSHWDGYPTCVGIELMERFNSYPSALNLILGGALSSLSSNLYYHNRKGEKWEYIKPMQDKTAKNITTQEYTYLFHNGEWYVSYWDENKYYLLKDVLTLKNPDDFTSEISQMGIEPTII